MYRRPLSGNALVVFCVVACSAPAPERVAGPERRELARQQLRERLGAEYDAPLPASGGELRHGAQLYNLLCRACHGPTGKGTGPSARMLPIRPPDLTDPVINAFFSDRAKLEIIAEGIAGTPMIGWKEVLDERERLEVLHYLNALVREPETP